MEKKKFEVKMRSGKNGTLEKAIFINDEQLDWTVDLSSFMEAKKMGYHFMREAQKSIEEHFIASVSDFLGRKVSMLEIKEAIKTGMI